MPLVHRPSQTWPGDMFRRFFDFDWLESGWMRIEEVRDEDALVINAELPGIDPDKDVEISVTDDVLHIRAERQEKSEMARKTGYRSEFRYGSFERSVTLPAGADADAVEAKYANGILTVRVPVSGHKEESMRVIPVSTGS